MPNLTPRSLERRLKRSLTRSDQGFSVTCLPGFEDLLRADLEAVEGVTVTQARPGGVELTAPFATVYELVTHQPIAERVFLHIAELRADSLTWIYNGLSKIAWELYVGFRPQVAVSGYARGSKLTHGGKIAEVAFKAISNRMKQLGQNIERDDADPLRIHIRVLDDRAHISLDASGPPMGRRTFTPEGVGESLDATFAAGLLRRLDAASEPVLLDPFCGGATLPIEAALMRLGRSPHQGRSSSLEHWPAFRPELLTRALETSGREAKGPQRIIGMDRNDRVAALARAAIDAAGVTELVELECRDWKQLGKHDVSKGPPGLLVAQPPSGRKTGQDGRIKRLYKQLNRDLGSLLPGWRVALLIHRPELIKGLGLEGERRTELSLGRETLTLVEGRIAKARGRR